MGGSSVREVRDLAAGDKEGPVDLVEVGRLRDVGRSEDLGFEGGIGSLPGSVVAAGGVLGSDLAGGDAGAVVLCEDTGAVDAAVVLVAPEDVEGDVVEARGPQDEMPEGGLVLGPASEVEPCPEDAEGPLVRPHEHDGGAWVAPGGFTVTSRFVVRDELCQGKEPFFFEHSTSR